MMKTDRTKELYSKYFNLINRKIEILLRNNTVLIGEFIGYFKGDEETAEPYILKWHFLQEMNSLSNEKVLFEDNIGEIIIQKDIKAIRFIEDGTIMEF
ncbi:MAG: hypothetical protein WCH34_02535 [Bacteroidota bacterium]